MLESPLKKNKHSYPIDFSQKTKEAKSKPPLKYDFVQTDEANPQKNYLNKNSITQAGLNVSQHLIETNKKDQKDNRSEYKRIRQAPQLNQDPQQNNLFNIQHLKKNFNLPQTEEPLKQILKKTRRIIIDQTKLKNSKIQINQDVVISTNEVTLEPVSPNKQQKEQKSHQFGSIRRQNFHSFEQFQNQKQNPLFPQQPFHGIHKNFRRNSLLEKLNLNKSPQKSKQFQNYLNQQFKTQKTTFYPASYTYANRLLASSQKFDKVEKLTRINSSFQSTKKKDNIILMNNQNYGNLSFNLRNIPLVKDFSVEKSTNKEILPTKIRSPVKSYLKSKNDFSPKSQQQISLNFSPNLINNLKSQINSVANSRLKQRSDQISKIHSSQRQFTFQNSQKNQQSKKEQNDFGKLKQIIKRPKKRLQITYQVPLIKLKNLCRTYLSCPNSYNLAFKVPKIFMQTDLFRKNQPKQEVHENGVILFDSLRINSKDIIIKRYSNCLMFIRGNVVVIWYYNGKRYLGGWQYEYLDEGSRHGLGLQWEPDVFIYYGEFRNNKKDGIGMMKEGPQKVTAGYWDQGRYIGTHYKQFQGPYFEQSFDQQPAQNEKTSHSQYFEYDER